MVELAATLIVGWFAFQIIFYIGAHAAIIYMASVDMKETPPPPAPLQTYKAYAIGRRLARACTL